MRLLKSGGTADADIEPYPSAGGHKGMLHRTLQSPNDTGTLVDLDL